MRVARVLCLAGLVHGGDGARECSQYEASHFSIVRYHYGHFDPSGASNARGDFLDRCGAVGSNRKAWAIPNTAISRMGRETIGLFREQHVYAGGMSTSQAPARHRDVSLML